MVNPEEQRKEAERAYRRIVDPKTWELKPNGGMVCELAGINVDAIFPRDLESFKEELGGDERIAKLHLTHYNKRRIKLLLKVSGKLAEMPPTLDTYANSNQFLTEVPVQGSPM